MRFPQIMLKGVRITGWILLALLIVQFITVAAIERWLPLGSIGDVVRVHVRTGLVIGVVALLHVIAGVYLAVRRWTWKSRHLQT